MSLNVFFFCLGCQTTADARAATTATTSLWTIHTPRTTFPALREEEDAMEEKEEEEEEGVEEEDREMQEKEYQWSSYRPIDRP